MDEIFALFDIDYIVGDRPEQAVEENRASVMKRIRRAIESDHKEVGEERVCVQIKTLNIHFPSVLEPTT